MAAIHETTAIPARIEDPAFFEHDADIEMYDQEDEGLLDEKEQLDEEGRDAPTPAKRPSKLLLWIAINIIATTAIVFINKSIFDDPSFRGAQVSFATFHFIVTFLTLHTVSSARFEFFERKRAALRDILPLAGAMCLNVILPNLSLAYSSITFYQTARVLLTPITALLNYVLYQKTIPRQAVCALVPVCVGVAMVTYFDVRPAASTKGTSFYGVVFALSGVLMSGIYTCWIGYYHQKLQMSSLQLLHNQSLLGAVLLVYLIPFVDTLPVFGEVPLYRWVMIMMSGLCACLLNLSQFAIIAGAGPVASTVVGHSKTVTIVTLGWIWSGSGISGYSALGVVIAIGGVVLYSTATTMYKK
ncbi:TPT-domain-containing protein [Aureobasidium pullulans]|uniref:TPT-domain-containing protein n=1 Tax=Aureobasidium pullulans TaxID=5580 RepID=A0A4S9VS17_AURPU|nr:TPT-domain-containing protein [Aureobasidium pullulans]THZ47285.1 TPT-domain-containing protein [Aureobasidium pullulans]THZ54548.1 TPT-domain-containing protein [Aureobasidium pullulans]